MVEREVIEKVKRFAKTLKDEGIQVAKVILYGSQVAGKFHRDSDIDVAIVSPDFGKDRFQEGVKLFEIAYKIDPRLEPVPISIQSFENETWLPLIYEIKTNGIEIDI